MCSAWLGGGAGVATFIPVPHLHSVYVPLSFVSPLGSTCNNPVPIAKYR